MKETLKEALEKFQKTFSETNDLEKSMKELAGYLLYKGYFLINNELRIYLREIEFYYFNEKDKNDRYNDYMMYHSTYKEGEKIDYFKVGTLFTHSNGIDITFEKKDCYRASALIRAFDVYKGNMLIAAEKRTSYIYDYMFMSYPIYDGLRIEWHEDDKTIGKIHQDVRINVCKYDKNVKIKKDKAEKGDTLTKNKKYIQDPRKWRFIREYDI